MTRILYLICFIFVIIIRFSPVAQGQSKECEKQNEIAVQSITLQEKSKSVRICYSVNVKKPDCEINLDLANITDLSKVEATLEIESISNSDDRIAYRIEGRELILTFSPDHKDKIFLVSFEDSRISFPTSNYQLDLDQKFKCAEISHFLKIKNDTHCDWGPLTKIYLQRDHKKIHLHQLTPFNLRPDSQRNILLDKVCVKDFSKKYVVRMSDFNRSYTSPKVEEAFPLLSINMTEIWPAKVDHFFFQDPGEVLIKYRDCNSCASWNTSYQAEKFNILINTETLGIVQIDDLLLTRSILPNYFWELKLSSNSELNSALRVDFQYTLVSQACESLNVSLEIDPQKKIREDFQKTCDPINDRSQKNIMHSVNLEPILLLVDIDTPLEKMAAQFNGEAKRLEAYSRFFKKSEKTPPDLQILSTLFKPAKPLKQTYSTGEDFLDRKNTAQSKNQIVFSRLDQLQSNAVSISKLFGGVPSEESYHNFLYALASLGNHDADVTLLRKQRKEQKAQAHKYIQFYNSIALEKINLYPIQFPSQFSNNSMNSLAKNGSSPTTVTPTRFSSHQSNYLPRAAAPKPPLAPSPAALDPIPDSDPNSRFDPNYIPPSPAPRNTP